MLGQNASRVERAAECHCRKDLNFPIPLAILQWWIVQTHHYKENQSYTIEQSNENIISRCTERNLKSGDLNFIMIGPIGISSCLKLACVPFAFAKSPAANKLDSIVARD